MANTVSLEARYIVIYKVYIEGVEVCKSQHIT